MQATLAELKLEVGAAQQLSSHAAKHLPRWDKVGHQEPMQWDLHACSPAFSPRITSGISIDCGGTSLLRQNALMRQLQESVAAHTTRMATIEGAPESMASLMQLLMGFNKAF